jgi:hypothetical protein
MIIIAIVVIILLFLALFSEQDPMPPSDLDSWEDIGDWNKDQN